MGLLIFEIFLPDRKRRRSSRPVAATPAMSAITETVAVLLLFMALPTVLRGSPSSALREYDNGNYQDAFRDYNKLLDKKDDPRLHFNAGAAAYQSRDLENAKKEFSGALASPDLSLQQRAYYNLGNTLYRIGQKMPDAAKKQEAWENALKEYESALKLNAQDGDAKYNQEYVKKQLELLKQQQQQQQQSKDNSKQDKKQDQQKQDQKNQDQKSQDNKSDQNSQQQQDQQKQQDQNSSGQKQDSQKDKQEKDAKDQAKQQEEQAKKQQQQQQAEKKDQQQASGQPKDKSQEEAEQEAAAMAAGRNVAATGEATSGFPKR